MSTTPILYELGHSEQQGPGFSPHVWKTKVDFGILGADYQSDIRSFKLIRVNLAQETGNDKITVPTLKTSDGYITDSWVIAEYLEKHYGSAEKSLFPGGEAGKAYAKFIEGWVNTTLAAELRPIIGGKIYERIDEASRKFKFPDQGVVDKLLGNLANRDLVEGQLPKARAVLKVLDDLLAAQGPYVAGSKPSHADALVYGWYAFSRVNPEIIKGVWEHSDLPNIGAWVKKVGELVDTKSLP